jgi:anaerobic selenocysteine-containing dehydrogenase
MSHQAIEPLGECRSNVEVFRALAQKMGFEDECLRDSADEMIDQALQSPNPWLKGLTRERLERDGHVRLNFGGNGDAAPFLPYANGNFRTPQGKALLYNADLAKQGLDPVASFVPPDESRHTPRAKAFPLELLARKADNFLNSTFTNLPSVQRMEESGWLEIHPADAEARNIRDGDSVRVFNNRGEIHLKAKVNGSVSRGVVAAKLGWAKLTPGGANINVLTSEKLTDMGNSATFYSVLVEVGLFQPDTKWEVTGLRH